MLQTVEAIIEPDGRITLLGEIKVESSRRALVTVLDEAVEPNECALLAEAGLSDWNRAEEDEAWSHLQPGR